MFLSSALEYLFLSACASLRAGPEHFFQAPIWTVSSNPMKIFTLCVALVMVAGCATFHPQPLSPSQTAAAFEARTLESHGLRAFLETTLHRAITPWPVEAWDITLLTLAALYYHPDLDGARSQWAVAVAGAVT